MFGALVAEVDIVMVAIVVARVLVAVAAAADFAPELSQWYLARPSRLWWALVVPVAKKMTIPELPVGIQAQLMAVQ